MSLFAKWLLASRPKTLLTSIAPIILGSFVALPWPSINWAIFISALLCALMLQIAVNFANDLFDGLSGVDTDERLGPIRTVQSGLIPPKHMMIALIIATIVSMILGLKLIFHGGWPFLLLGILSVVGIFAYSAGSKSLASLGLGEVTVFLFFGLIAVLGSHYLQQPSLPWYAWALSINTGLFASATLLVNNIRDIETDLKANKVTLAARLGHERAHLLLRWMLISPIVLHLFLLTIDSLLILPIAICLFPLLKITQDAKSIIGKDLNPLLGKIALINFIYCCSTAITWQLLL